MNEKHFPMNGSHFTAFFFLRKSLKLCFMTRQHAMSPVMFVILLTSVLPSVVTAKMIFQVLSNLIKKFYGFFQLPHLPKSRTWVLQGKSLKFQLLNFLVNFPYKTGIIQLKLAVIRLWQLTFCVFKRKSNWKSF